MIIKILEKDGESIMEPIAIIRERLCKWLKKSKWTTEEFVNWLLGYEFPPLGHDDEPHIWIIRAIGRDQESASRLAKRIGRFLIENIESQKNKLGKRPEQTLYNLLMLSAELHFPKYLASPLYKMYKRKQLQGEWEGIKLEKCLEIALKVNMKTLK